MSVKEIRIAVAAAMIISSFAAAPVVFSSNAEAKTYTKREHINRDKCYRVEKVPALVEYNTRGIKVRDASRSWKGNLHSHGSVVRDKYHAEVYIQTRRVVEREHTTLVPVSC